ncbi:MAG: Crp/Fnr family transcriptional regulator [Mesorhizobium sp.]|uniref:Crp/Fnr family transcriptional regulator n=1 Tax=Mesorhizobium sp. TaxID=1871066 RepID=UPI000FE6DCD9|nr:Crp/Fnr family transcriptional regulator [Mesorhizobium sp.]RWH82162.1 MAG: Crp/Fnr family transcriptional regulator [Mesorhizobium sp.]RWH85163.1 MAG: Crp/Fnr family transcriptional regulator [Mesorhizobium sp.]RWH89918.1 MAG: Crp/Fnr family transcriptional regulator [Mesorhizobium sp.]RWH98332.1 MAG: Crp/Fnr family transcriptional regulator [Mesorhizobium sp.]RWI04660.1 MAG: Crp/Fnr family transcriptional regulator [Mesorhizobium sp.]
MEIPAREETESFGNNLLQALRLDDWAIMQPRLEEWSAPTGTVLHEPGDTVHYAYFPRGPSLVSYLVILSDGRALETALVGREGAVGGIVSQGRLPAFARAEVQLGGSFFRIELHHLEEAKSRSLTLRYLFARYADCLMAQVFQSVACNAAHSIEQRTARWLLAAIERTGADNLALTQEQLAVMLGVGRSYLSRVIRELRQRGIIETRRARIVVRSVDGLRSLACECNAAVARHFNDVLKGVYPAEQTKFRRG